MLRAKTILPLSLVLFLPLLACSGPDQPTDVVCTAVALPAIHLTVEDAVTGAPVEDALATARDGDFVESHRTVIAWGAAFASFGEECPGVYDLSVQKDGYVGWSLDGVVAAAGRCHVDTQEVDVRLHPVASS